jgi:hypothetical protein
MSTEARNKAGQDITRGAKENYFPRYVVLLHRSLEGTCDSYAGHPNEIVSTSVAHCGQSIHLKEHDLKSVRGLYGKILTSEFNPMTRPEP